jgi:hypothetical protein
MAANRTADQVQARSTVKTIGLDAAAVDYAIRLIHEVCCLAGSFDLLEDFRDQDLRAAVDRRDSAGLFNRLMHDFSFQGISDEIATNYMRRHGHRRPGAQSKRFWPTGHFHGCRYEKTSRTCAEPDHIAGCPLPTHHLRNGHLNQIAYSLYLFIRDVADGDLVGWIDNRLRGPAPLAEACNALIEPLRHVYGVSDKVLAMALSGILIGAGDARPRWREVGVQLIAVDTLVHNFLHRTGILTRFKASHPYGPGCYRPGGCAGIIRLVASKIDARQFNPSFPQVFPRFVQLAIWRYCSQQGFDICNGNRLDDRHRCQNRHCRLYAICDRISLK